MSVRVRPEQIELRDRSGEREPLVSILIPCFNHGHYLSDGLETVRAQTYAAIEPIVVDDGSDDPHTLEVLHELEWDQDVRLVRLPENRGVAAAMNAAVEAARGRYVIPFDADNKLLPNAIADLVQQLNQAAPPIGFIYPNVQYFGNRNDYFKPPAYNVFTLLQGNYCDHCSLIDRDVFDQGVSYVGGLFREDWHLFIEMAKRGVYGEPARTKTFLYRKRGFNRSDLVGHIKGTGELDAGVRDRHPEFFSSTAAYAAVKADWLPALSIVALTPLEDDGAQRRLREALERQTAIDAEAIVFAPHWDTVTDGPNVRALSPSLAGTTHGALRSGLAAARGRTIVLTDGTGADLVSDSTFVEKLIRVLRADGQMRVLAFAQDPADDSWPWRPLKPSRDDLRPHAVAWSVDRLQDLRGPITIGPGPAVAAMLEGLAGRTRPQWRALPTTEDGRDLDRSTEVMPVDNRVEAGANTPQAMKLASQAVLPGVPEDLMARPRIRPWRPAQTLTLFRHQHLESGLRVVSESGTPPAGCRFEYRLGTAKYRHVPGLARLDIIGGAMSPKVDFAANEELSPVDPSGRTLGWIEESSLPMLAPLKLAEVPHTGQRTLVAGPEDPLFSQVNIVQHLGFIEPSPLYPRAGLVGRPDAAPVVPTDVVGLLRAVHPSRKRHEYAVGVLPKGELVGELGSLHFDPVEGSIPVSLTPGGVLTTASYMPTWQRPSVATAIRWALSPLSWHDVLGGFGRLRTALGRFGTAFAAVVRTPSAPSGVEEPVGHLYADVGPGRVPLFSALHPVTGDQLLTQLPGEADKMGYGAPEILGYLDAVTPVTGVASQTAVRSVTVPWAWKLGRAGERERARVLERGRGPEGEG